MCKIVVGKKLMSIMGKDRTECRDWELGTLTGKHEGPWILFRVYCANEALLLYCTLSPNPVL